MGNLLFIYCISRISALLHGRELEAAPHASIPHLAERCDYRPGAHMTATEDFDEFDEVAVADTSDSHLLPLTPEERSQVGLLERVLTDFVPFYQSSELIVKFDRFVRVWLEVSSLAPKDEAQARNLRMNRLTRSIVWLKQSRSMALLCQKMPVSFI